MFRKSLLVGPVVKVVTWSRGGAHLTKPGWRSKPHTHSIPTNLALFGHKITLYRFNQGAHRVVQIGAGAEPLCPPHFNQWVGLMNDVWQRCYWNLTFRRQQRPLQEQVEGLCSLTLTLTLTLTSSSLPMNFNRNRSRTPVERLSICC